MAFVVLVEDSGCERYRLSAEIRHDHAAGVDCGVGVVVGLRECEFGDGSMHVGCLVRFNDVDDARGEIQPARKFAVRGNLLRLFPYIVVLASRLTEPEEYKLPGDDLIFHTEFDPTRPRWRSIEIEVGPDCIAASWDDDERQLTLRTAQVKIGVQRTLLSFPKAKASDSAQHNVNVSERGGLGLYVRNGSISFRNVVIEPLPTAR